MILRKILNSAVLCICTLWFVLSVSKCAAPIAVSPLAKVSVSDVYDSKKYKNPFEDPNTRNRKRGQVKKIPVAKLRKKLIVNEPTLDSLRLTGIMLSGNEKQAVLYDTNTRQTYFLIGDKLYNRDVQAVKGFSGKVLAQSVILEKGAKKRTIVLPGGR